MTAGKRRRVSERRRAFTFSLMDSECDGGGRRFHVSRAQIGFSGRNVFMNAFNVFAVSVCLVFAHSANSIEESAANERRRPRKEVTRVEPPAKTDVAPGKDTALCNEAGNVKYLAKWENGKVTLTAAGSHRTAGYKVFFEQSMLMIYPPEFILKHKAPAELAATVITPFKIQTSFKADERPQAITVHDAKGRNRVPVQ